MYIPSRYSENDWELQKSVIEEYPLGTVITSTDKGIIANHIPFIVVDDGSGKIKLQAHIAKANHQLPDLQNNENVMVIFSSVNSYIAPEYYATKQETHKVVPTWDFAAVHCYGKSSVIDDKSFVRKQLDALTHSQEKSRAKEWTVDEAPEKYVDLMHKAITGLEIEIDRIEGKFKFEQTMPQKNIDGVVNGLAADGKPRMSEFVEVTNQRRAAQKAANA